MTERRCVAVAAGMCLGLAMALTSCTSDPTGSPSQSASSSEASLSPASAGGSTQAPPQDQEQAILDGYMGFFVTGLETGGLSVEEIRVVLAPFATAELIGRFGSIVTALASEGQVPAGVVTFNTPRVVDVDGDQASVNECRDGTTEQIVDSATGQVVSQGSLARSTRPTWFSATMVGGGSLPTTRCRTLASGGIRDCR